MRKKRRLLPRWQVAGVATSVTCVEDSEGVLAAIAGSDVLDGGENPVASFFVRRRSGQLLRCFLGETLEEHRNAGWNWRLSAT